MNAGDKVWVVNAPGYEDFMAEVVMWVPNADDEIRAVVMDHEGEYFVFPEEYIREV